MAVRKIISIDGGGIRGIIPATVLSYIEQRTGYRICELFDTAAGTSTGAIIALCLSVPNAEGLPKFTSAQCVELYEHWGSKIFPANETWERKFLPIRAIKPFAYKPDGLENVLLQHFENTFLSDSLMDLLIYTAQLSPPGLLVFKTSDALQSDRGDFAMRDIARATSAAPTYFPPARIMDRAQHRTFTLVDGGTLANCPALKAYFDTRRRFPDDEVFIVSLGTGAATSKNRIKANHIRFFPPLFTASKIVSMQMDGTSKEAHRELMLELPVRPHHGIQCETRQYYRIQCRLEPDTEDLDDSSIKNIKKLRALAEDMIDDNRDVLDFICEKLVAFKTLPIE